MSLPPLLLPTACLDGPVPHALSQGGRALLCQLPTCHSACSQGTMLGVDFALLPTANNAAAQLVQQCCRLSFESGPLPLHVLLRQVWHDHYGDLGVVKKCFFNSPLRNCTAHAASTAPKHTDHTGCKNTCCCNLKVMRSFRLRLLSETVSLPFDHELKCGVR